MSIKFTNSNQNVDSKINQSLSNIMLSRFKKGLATQKQEDGSTSDQDGDDKTGSTVSIVNPSKTMNLPRSKSKSYGVERTTLNVKNKISSDKGVEFIQQSKVLNNELDHMLGLMRLNNKEQFYEKPYVKGSGIIRGGSLLTNKDKEFLDNLSDVEISNLIHEHLEKRKELLREHGADDERTKRADTIVAELIEYNQERVYTQHEGFPATSDDEGDEVHHEPIELRNIPSPVPSEPLKTIDFTYILKKDNITYMKKLNRNDVSTYYNECLRLRQQKPSSKKIKSNLTTLKDILDNIPIPRDEVDEKNEEGDEEKDDEEDKNEHPNMDPFVAYTPEIKELIESQSIADLKDYVNHLKTIPASELKAHNSAQRKKLKKNIRTVEEIIVKKEKRTVTQSGDSSLPYQERNRDQSKGEIEKLTLHDRDNLKNELSGANKDVKIKNGLRVVGEVEAKNIPNDVFLISKKISNLITVTLSPLAQYLANIKYTTLSNGDIVSVKKLYKEIDEKMYILTSTNNKTNDMFIRLDKEFDRLYDLIKNGIQNYNPTLMYSGGSLIKRQSQTIDRQSHLSRNLLNHAYYL